MAGGTGNTIYVWDITCSDAPLFKTLVGHTNSIIALTFPSSLISVSHDQSVKFWQIGASPTNPVATNTASAPPTSATIMSVSLQAKQGIAISSDLAGTVKVSRSMGATYCWGIPRGIVLGFGEVWGDGMDGGRLRTRGSLAE